MEVLKFQVLLNVLSTYLALYSFYIFSNSFYDYVFLRFALFMKVDSLVSLSRLAESKRTARCKIMENSQEIAHLTEATTKTVKKCRQK